MDDESDQLNWQAHPARERRGQALLGAAVIAAVGALVGVMCRLEGVSPLMSTVAGIGSSALLLLSTNRFYFASRFSIDQEGITARYPLRQQHLAWSAVRRFLHDSHGGFLSTRAGRSRLDAFQGLHLLFDDAQEIVIERITTLIRMHGPEAKNAVAHAAGEEQPWAG